MSGSNLPPGCRASDIPGNRPEDAAQEAAEEWVLEHFAKEGLTPDEYKRAAVIGASVVVAERIMLKPHVREVTDAQHLIACINAVLQQEVTTIQNHGSEWTEDELDYRNGCVANLRDAIAALKRACW